MLSAFLALLFADVDFAREVRPILSDRCFHCHGPDSGTRMAGLRLDLETEARKPRGARTPVVPGNASASEIFKRIADPNPARRMPPAYAGGKPLTDREIALVKSWIDQGARWQSHWAFDAPRRPDLPSVSDAQWVRNPIDAFVLARLDREKLKPARELDRERLLRRVSLDLTGLPPTPAELDAFLADRSPGAYEKQVDRLLASPRFGERMAVEWLDAARYADTHGYQVDPEKEMWPWRDWVVDAFNRNLSFDRFTIEQLAGDLLPKPTLEQRIATGFNRNHRVNNETGSIAEEFQAENVIDRISTTGTVWLGLTVGCARCHDHKYDPITMKDFYSLYAFFNNVPELGTGGPRDGRGNYKPLLKLPAPELEKQVAELESQIAAKRRELRRLEDTLSARQPEWEKSALTAQPQWQVLAPLTAASEGGATLTVQPDGSVLASGPRPAKDIYTVTADLPAGRILAIRLELLPDPSLPAGGSGRGDGGKSTVTLFETKLDGKALDFARISADYSSPDSILDRVLRPMLQLARGWTLDAETARPHFAVVEPRTTLQLDAPKRAAFRIGGQYGEGRIPGRFRLSVTADEFPEPLPADIRKALESAARDEKQTAALRGFHASHRIEYRLENDQLTALETRKRGVENRIPSTMVMEEMAEPRESFILQRGSYEKPGAKVTAAVPGFLPPLPEGAPRNRLGFAQWLVDGRNPLTARVTVNRYWQSYFGAGLVRTSEDFGSQGSPPTHPELLDWLATEFMASGWDVKHMQRLIVTSATYRQDSRLTPELRERDPENRLLARGPRFRLSGEAIRDQALYAAGLLKEKLGGPSVKPYQPDGLWEQLSVIDDRKLYVRSTGDDLWRRSLYTYWKRTVPPPALTTFDAPTREFCVVKRPLSSTPLQALVLLNDETFLEAARVLAQRMMKQSADPDARLAHGFRLAAARRAAPEEISILRRGLEARLKQYRANPTAAAALLKAGEAPLDQTLDPAELAAYATTAGVLLNLDEVVTRQ